MTTKNKSKADLNQPEVIINPTFQKLLPILTPEESKSLEKDIKENGCRDALVVGRFTEDGEEKEYLIDGHNRYRICKKHNISYHITPPIEFESREAVIAWIITNQKNRRNMTKFRWVELALNYEKDIAKEAKENQKMGGKGLTNSTKPIHTRKKLGEIANAGPETITRIKYILENASDDDKNKLRMGYSGLSINSVYLELLKKASKPKNISKVTLATDDNTEKLRNIFGDKLGVILADLEDFGQSLEKKGDIRKVNSLATMIKKLLEKV